jgi:hypothetical protein
MIFPEYLCEVSVRMSIHLQAIFLVCNFLSDEIDTFLYQYQIDNMRITVVNELGELIKVVC